MVENQNKYFDEAKVHAEVNDIIKWCSDKFKIVSYNENFIRNFLRKYNYDQQICKEKLIRYFLYKKIYSEYLQPGDLKYDHEFRTFCVSVFSLYMPVLTSRKYRVYVDKITNNENLFDICKIMKYFAMQTDLRFSEDESADDGDIILFDCNHVNLLNFIAFTPYFIKSLTLVLEVYPLQLKLLILVNTGKCMAILLNIFKVLFLQKFTSVFYVYSSGPENFLKHVEVSVLPSDYGGILPNLEVIRDDWICKLHSYHQWFTKTNHEINTCQFEPEEISHVFGINGSFRNLVLD